MGNWPRLAKLACVLAVTQLFSEKYAQAEGPSSSGDIVIWYRASQDCPSGAEFVSGVQVAGRKARLARVGDHVDYVITLESDGKVSGGRLERQTERGTIAISELRGGACRDVAEALSLSLGLAVTPSQPAPTPAPQPEPEPEPAAAQPQAHDEAAPQSQSDSAASPAAGVAESPVVPSWWIGGGLEARFGLTPSVSGGASLFVRHDWAAFSQQRRASLRIGPSFSYSRPSIERLGHVDQWITTLGLEFCPLRFSRGSLGFAPCAAGEAGLFVASSSRDTALTSVKFWSAMGPALRGSAQVSSSLQFGLGFAVMVPFSRIEVMAGTDVLYRTSPMVFSLGADLSWAIP